ncbi:MAG TPA: hypothetical protein VGR12_06395 [Solirubrobacteraceae bacterium]|nr:hypothetical protein [Solirubrobacteraceae bacterium]
MREFLAWALLFCVIGMWIVVPWRAEPTLRLFNAESDEELLRRFAEHRRFMVSVGLVVLMDVVAVVLALTILI